MEVSARTVLLARLSPVLWVHMHQLQDERPARHDAGTTRQEVSANQTLQHRAFPTALLDRKVTAMLATLPFSNGFLVGV